MTVKELRELLYKCNDEYEVAIDGDASIGEVQMLINLTDDSKSQVIIWSC